MANTTSAYHIMPIMKKTRRASTHKQEEISVTPFAPAPNRFMRTLTTHHIFSQMKRKNPSSKPQLVPK
eukprot:scaffold23601_cov78-Skeletonema_dohrnii-CCMP3373.AAC.3